MNENKKDFRRAIYARAAVVCFALAAGLGFLWFGVLVGFQEAIAWAIIITVAGCVIFWPSEPMPRRKDKKQDEQVSKHN